MDFLAPESWADALRAKAERPEAVAICGGTDLMVEINFDRRRPAALLDLSGIAELGTWERMNTANSTDPVNTDSVRIGAGVPFSQIIHDLADVVPGLAIASRTVGSPQIRNRGTLGGQLGTASPAGDAVPPLVTSDAIVEVESIRGPRDVPVREFFTGPKRNVLAPDELIRAVRVPVADGPQQFAKVGTRNAMVISVCGFAISLSPPRREVATCIGSAGPTVLRAPDAEDFLMGELDRSGLWESRDELREDVVHRFGELVSAAARPIDDVRGTAAYRRHAVGVLGRRTLGWTWTEYRGNR